MKAKHLFPFSVAISLLLLAPQGSRAGVLLDDSWASSSYREQSLPRHSAWFSSGTRPGVATNALTFYLHDTSFMAITYFTEDPEQPVEIAPGKELTATFWLSLNDVAPANPSFGFRLGLFNFAGSSLVPKRVSGKKFSSASQGQGVQGYALFQNMSAALGTTPLNIRKRTAIEDGLLLGKTEDWTSLARPTNSLPKFAGFTNDVVYTLTVSLQRMAPGSMLVGVTWSNMITGAQLAASATDTNATNFAFDGIALRAMSDQTTARSITLKRARVELAPATR